MIGIYPTSTVLACGALVVLATPSYAGAHAPGCAHMTGPRPMMPPPPAHMSMHHMPMMHGTGGCCGGGGHMAYGGKPPLGMHWKGMHFYGMSGGGHMAEIHGMGNHSYTSGSYGAGGMRPTLGTHLLGSHYYGMASGSLAQKYGQLEYHVSPLMPPRYWGTKYGSGHGSMGLPKAWAATSYRASYSAHYAYRIRYGYRMSSSLGHYGTYHAKKPWAGASGQWGYNGAPSGQWAYAAK